MASLEKKQRERRIIEEVRRLYADFPKGQIIDNERPDFLVEDSGNVHCIELVDFVRGQTERGSPKRQSEVVWGQIASEARKKFETTHTEPLWVLFSWRDAPYPAKKDVQVLATAAVNLVAANIPTKVFERLEINNGQLADTIFAEYLVAVHVMKVRNPKQALWHYISAGFVSPVQNEFQDLIDKKNSHPASYPSECATTWLIVVAQGFPLSSVVGTEGMDKFSLTSDFGHVLFYDRAEKRIIPLLRNATRTEPQGKMRL